jgi:hypothetical protein
MMKLVLRKAIFIIVLLQFFSVGKAQQLVSISGYITEKSSGEMLGGVAIALYPSRYSTSSNSYGFYSISARKNNPQKIYYRFPGFQLDSFIWSAKSDTSLSVGLVVMPQGDDFEKIKQIEIVTKKSTIADKVEMSKIDIPINQIKEIPALLGEKDVMKVIQLLPGVQKGGEGQSGIYVRGGGPDQNLIILDEATVYNANHLFGFFSVFNGDALKSVELTKGGFPARYGGRLSSVIDLNMKEGNNQKYAGEVGIGIISSRFTFEGPIKKGKSSFMVSGRRTYLDILAQPLIMAASDGLNAGYYFYDMNAKFNYIISEKDKLFVSGYFGRDNFYVNDKTSSNINEFSFGWGNRTLTGRWNHQFTPRLFSNLSLIYSHYDLTLNSTSIIDKDSFSLNYSSTINDFGFKYDFDWRPLPNHQMRYGISVINHRFSPSAIVIRAGGEDLLNKTVDVINTYESGAYIEDQIKMDDFKFMPSFRLSHYLIGSKKYLNPEPRLSVSYNYSKSLAFKGAYSVMNQYIHLLSSSGVGLPTDLWVPATENIKPMRSQQVALGFAKDYKGGYSLSIESYYKTMENMIQYKDGASFFLQDNFDPNVPSDSRSWESQVTAGTGKSYGTEVFIQKQMGKFSGWIGYTLSWTILKFDELNDGKPFYAKYDRRHDLSLVGIYKISKNFTLAATWVYGTGNAITMPQGYMASSSHQLSSIPYVWNPSNTRSQIDYTSRNNFRMEPYHRLDIGLRFSKDIKKGLQTWELSFYNAYSRMNPFFYYGSENSNSVVTLKKVTLFPLIPSISWSLKFK